MNAKVLDLGVARDSVESLQSLFAQASESDVIISTGGVSVGEADFVKSVLESIGSLHLWKVAMKPGRPLSVGKLDSGPVFFGLPGNPVSGMVTFALFVNPLLRKLGGLPFRADQVLIAKCNSRLKKAPGRVEFQRGVLSAEDNGDWVVDTTGVQESHVLSSMQKANCFIKLPLESDGIRAGEDVQVLRFEDVFKT